MTPAENRAIEQRFSDRYGAHLRTLPQIHEDYIADTISIYRDRSISADEKRTAIERLVGAYTRQLLEWHGRQLSTIGIVSDAALRARWTEDAVDALTTQTVFADSSVRIDEPFVHA
jgi:hypothetical protein